MNGTSRRDLIAEELVDRHKKLPRVDHAKLRQEDADLFGGEDADPWERTGPPRA